MAGSRTPCCVLLCAMASALLAATAIAAPAASDPLPISADSRLLRLAGGLTIDQAIKMAEQRYKARVVRAEAQESDGRTIYVLRLLNEHGRVWTVRVDAANGTVL